MSCQSLACCDWRGASSMACRTMNVGRVGALSYVAPVTMLLVRLTCSQQSWSRCATPAVHHARSTSRRRRHSRATVATLLRAPTACECASAASEHSGSRSHRIGAAAQWPRLLARLLARRGHASRSLRRSGPRARSLRVGAYKRVRGETRVSPCLSDAQERGLWIQDRACAERSGSEQTHRNRQICHCRSRTPRLQHPAAVAH